MAGPKERNFKTWWGWLGALAAFWAWGPLVALLWLATTDRQLQVQAHLEAFAQQTGMVRLPGLLRPPEYVRLLVAVLILAAWVWLMIVRPLRRRTAANAGYDPAVPKGWARRLHREWPNSARKLGWYVPGDDDSPPVFTLMDGPPTPHPLGVKFKLLTIPGPQSVDDLVAGIPFLEGLLGFPIEVIKRDSAWVEMVAVFTNPLANSRQARDHGDDLSPEWST